MTGSEMTGSEMTGSEMTGSEMTGSEMTGSEMTSSVPWSLQQLLNSYILKACETDALVELQQALR